MRISDWSSDVCSSDLIGLGRALTGTRSRHNPDITILMVAYQPIRQRGGARPVGVVEKYGAVRPRLARARHRGMTIRQRKRRRIRRAVDPECFIAARAQIIEPEGE